MNRIDRYSAKKIKRKETEPNSVLKPLTNSDSPSEKSKGERFVSASEVTKRSSIMPNKNNLSGTSFEDISE